MKILLANPRGFCAGVERALQVVERVLESEEAPLYVRHELVHNHHVVDHFKERGVRFVEKISLIPDHSSVVLSAHGVSEAVESESRQRPLQVFDATCPLVTKVHLEVMRYARDGYDVILIGHEGHPEVEGTLGRFDPSHGGEIHLIGTVADARALAPRQPDRIGVVAQTTLSIDDTREIVKELRRRFPKLHLPSRSDICYATQNRQDAVKKIVGEINALLVVGAANSSNSNRLREIGERNQLASYLIDSASALQRDWFSDDDIIGLTAGASAPELLVQEVIEALKRDFPVTDVIESPGIKEDTVFKLPRELSRTAAPRVRSVGSTN